MAQRTEPIVGIIMGSTSDWDTMRHAHKILTEFGVPHECKVVSAHRTPQWTAEYATSAEARGLEIIIAGAGGAAHLPGMVASLSPLPVIGVPVKSRNSIDGWDFPVGTLSIGKSGAKNAALMAISILGNKYPEYREALKTYRKNQTETVLSATLPIDEA